jgi:hypothetical protein
VFLRFGFYVDKYTLVEFRFFGNDRGDLRYDKRMEAR